MGSKHLIQGFGFFSETSTLWLSNIAMGNGPFIDGLPIEFGDFHGYVK